jgi:hypothetical protein
MDSIQPEMPKKEKYIMYLLFFTVTIIGNIAFKVFDPSQAATVSYVNEENKRQDERTEKTIDNIINYVDKMDGKVEKKLDENITLILNEIRFLREDLKLKKDR